jgi:hypothetical protein
MHRTAAFWYLGPLRSDPVRRETKMLRWRLHSTSFFVTLAPKGPSGFGGLLFHVEHCAALATFHVEHVGDTAGPSPLPCGPAIVARWPSPRNSPASSSSCTPGAACAKPEPSRATTVPTPRTWPGHASFPSAQTTISVWRPTLPWRPPPSEPPTRWGSDQEARVCCPGKPPPTAPSNTLSLPSSGSRARFFSLPAIRRTLASSRLFVGPQISLPPTPPITPASSTAAASAGLASRFTLTPMRMAPTEPSRPPVRSGAASSSLSLSSAWTATAHPSGSSPDWRLTTARS